MTLDLIARTSALRRLHTAASPAGTKLIDIAITELLFAISPLAAVCDHARHEPAV